ncbi:MAG: PadR family transcriptional regulator [Bacteroidia bacterium]|nr:PadR family transcriptional regulator [Bacteroidia bacterium]
MNIENAKAQMRKGVLEYCILSILSKHDCYASDIINKMKEAQLIVVEGTLYPLLTRLKNDSMLSYRWEESTQGPPRKYYKLTEQGEPFLKELNQSWDELVEAVRLINNKVNETINPL